ncbi:MAG: anaerobic ribonucleoside-triphosphate reductase [Thermoprotei archaeon]|nr:MAG: anaerobic ribonucleoside-triphosphate reductase [Thermoprotei archaeon]
MKVIVQKSKSISEEKASEIIKAEKEYIERASWDVYENANMNMSYSNFRNFLFDRLIKKPEVLSKYLPEEAVSDHFRGDLHIHKLPDSLFIPYCIGWSFKKILKKGLITPTIVSKPARHVDTAIAHLTNFFFFGSQEYTGAQAASGFDVFLAPFIRKDKTPYNKVKQAIQHMLFNLNYPARAGFQSPFTNITLVLDTSEQFLKEHAVIGGKELPDTLGDYLDEILVINKALLELLIEGDAKGQPFTFPIPTLMITKNFDWNGKRWGEVSDLIFEALARRGSAYLLNGYSTNVESLYSMCCRLTIDVSRLNNNNSLKHQLSGFRLSRDLEEIEEYLIKNRQAFGIWALPDATGSIGVVTLNMPRLAALSRGEWDIFEEMLYTKMENARRVLLTWRKRYAVSLRSGLMPISRIYLGHFRNHFNTFGVIGLPEAAANFMRNPKLWFEGSRGEIGEAVKIMKKMVKMVREKAMEYEETDDYLYNVEEIPGESTSYRLARLDMKYLKEEIEKEEVLIPTDGIAPFYSNSIIPYYANISIPDRARWEGEVQQEFTGGVMMHLFLQESPDPKALKSLVRSIALNTKVVYFSITPTIAICRKCGWQAIGLFEKCPKCGHQVDLWSRIVGYYRPLRSWNVGKRAEFKLRVQYRAFGG